MNYNLLFPASIRDFFWLHFGYIICFERTISVMLCPSVERAHCRPFSRWLFISFGTTCREGTQLFWLACSPLEKVDHVKARLLHYECHNLSRSPSENLVNRSTCSQSLPDVSPNSRTHTRSRETSKPVAWRENKQKSARGASVSCAIS